MHTKSLLAFYKLPAHYTKLAQYSNCFSSCIFFAMTNLPLTFSHIKRQSIFFKFKLTGGAFSLELVSKPNLIVAVFSSHNCLIEPTRFVSAKVIRLVSLLLNSALFLRFVVSLWYFFEEFYSDNA